MDVPTSQSTSAMSRFFAAPLELKAFAVFCVLVTVVDFGTMLTGPKTLREAIVPVTGWVGSMGYMFSLYFIFFLILSRAAHWRSMRFAVVTMLLIPMVLGIKDVVGPASPNFNNPYLTISPWRPVWTLVIPALWIAILYSPRIKKYCELRMQNYLSEQVG